MFKILVVEDDFTIANIVKKELEKWQYNVKTAEDFNSIVDLFLDYEPHLVIMDISLPYFNGYYWCEEIRKHSDVPIVFLSSKDDNMDIIMAIQMGADDYIIKPFDLQVFIAKINAIIRRAYSFGRNESVIKLDNMILNLNKHSLTVIDSVIGDGGKSISSNNGNNNSDDSSVRDASEIELTKNETKILEMLFNSSGSYVTREDIMVKLWDDEEFIDENTLTVNIARLRKKLSQNGIDDFIKTKKGYGYGVDL